MRNFKNVVIGMALALIVSGTASADNRPYGMSGCGLWTYVIKGQSMGEELAKWALKNLVFYDFQTSGITTGTSNCVNDAKSHAQNEQQVYVAVNMSELSKEAAQGGGQHVNALSQIFGCENHEGFAKLSQSHYSQIFETTDPEAVLNNYKNELRSNEELACSKVS
jgi:hypothetical protein